MSLLIISGVSKVFSFSSSFDVFTIETRFDFFLSATRGASTLFSFTQNLSMHFRSDAGVDGADTVQKMELSDAKIGKGEKFKPE